MHKPHDPDYWRKWRAAHPAYRERERDRLRARKASMTPEERRRDRGLRKSRAVAPLEPLYAELRHGQRVSFWEDELRMDLAQERALAEVEGRNPDAAVATYRTRELVWRFFAGPLLID